ncbi:MAG: Rieske (2Fe-2S) protein [Mucilaginibacter sp.]
MERAEFISKFGIGVIAVCAGCGIASCSSGSKNDNPAPAQPTPPAAGSGNLFSADLNSELLNVGDSKVVKNVIVVRLASGNASTSFTAVQVICTHQGANIGYNASQGLFICPAHGSEFSQSGQVVQGPALAPLQKYNVTITNNILTVSA